MTNQEPRRFGLYYSTTTDRYRQADLEGIIPLLHRMGVGWLVVRSTAARAVPEDFLKGLLAHGITPFVHFVLPLETPPAEVGVLLRSYARWGVRHVAFFDRPNLQGAWGRAWGQPDLPARFLDAFTPLAAAADVEGLQPFFPPLAPGGDYWDLAFLRAALQGLRRRNPLVAERLGLCAYAWAEGKPLDWGRGGPEVWPAAQPYFTPPDSEDHRGFRIFDWYAVEARAALGRVPPIFLLGMGSRYGCEPDEAVESKNTAIARLFWENDLPAEVLGGAFWVLTAPAESPEGRAAWLEPSGKPRGTVAALEALRPQSPRPERTARQAAVAARRYILLPTFARGVPPHYLSAALPWLQRGEATVGFSVEEALRAQHITLLGSPDDFPPEARTALQASGATLEWVPVNSPTEVAL